MKDIITKINEARLSDKTLKPFTSKEELDNFIKEVEETKKIIQHYEKEAQVYWDRMTKCQNDAEKEFRKLGYDKLKGEEWDQKYDEIFQGKYKLDELMNKATEVMKTPECVKANERLYGELQQRALDSLSPKEQKAIGKRGGRMYNILAEVFKKYMHYDFKKNKPVE